MIPRHVLSMITKAQIMAFLSLSCSLRITKEQLVWQLQRYLEANTYELVRLLDTFPYELAVGPTELQHLLQCTSSERYRWIRDGRIPILAYRDLAAPGIRYPVHDRRIVQRVTPYDVQHWRREDFPRKATILQFSTHQGLIHLQPHSLSSEERVNEYDEENNPYV